MKNLGLHVLGVMNIKIVEQSIRFCGLDFDFLDNLYYIV